MSKFKVEVMLPTFFTVEVEASDDAEARAKAEAAVMQNPESYLAQEGCYEATDCNEA